MNQGFSYAMKNEEIRKAFGVRVKELRKQKKWTQNKELGKPQMLQLASLPRVLSFLEPKTMQAQR